MSSTEDASARVSLMSENFGSWIYPTATAIVLFVVWEAVARYGAISPLLLPAPSALSGSRCRVGAMKGGMCGIRLLCNASSGDFSPPARRKQPSYKV